MRIELTDAKVKGFSTDRRVDLVDTREPGLIMRVTPTGSRTWSFRGRSADGTLQRVTIGAYPDVSLRDARRRAAMIRLNVRSTAGNLNAIQRSQVSAAAANPTLADLMKEYADGPGGDRKTWQRSVKGGKSEAELRINAVFARLLLRQVTSITPDDIALAMKKYEPLSGKSSANGQVSRARAYLMPVLDWSAGRGRFAKAGKRRQPTVAAPDARDTHDPASDDHAIVGLRERVLYQDELQRILPLLRYPAPEELAMRMPQDVDLRPLALRFILLTAARLDEVVRMRWEHIDWKAGTWFKPSVKSTRGPARPQTLPLSDAALDLLKSLPHYKRRTPEQLCFPNTVGDELDNWDRVTKAIHRESKTSDWHRHDLRRTSATILELLEVPPRVIARILAHKLDHHKEGTSRALENYVRGTNVLDRIDPQKAALDKLADVYLDMDP